MLLLFSDADAAKSRRASALEYSEGERDESLLEIYFSKARARSWLPFENPRQKGSPHSIASRRLSAQWLQSILCYPTRSGLGSGFCLLSALPDLKNSARGGCALRRAVYAAGANIWSDDKLEDGRAGALPYCICSATNAFLGIHLDGLLFHFDVDAAPG